MQIGYIRVSTNDQNTDLQRNALNCAGCELIFEDKISGTKSARPGLKKLLRTLSEGDTLVVWKLDRLGRSMKGTVAKLAMRQPFVLFKGLTFQKLCLPGAFRPGDHHNKMLRPGLCVV
ncbi:recombinase family protein, partial [Escherichia coli]|uniref:recombinase family protein n=1 Tax=Escherichia coli TaxID=562 RepID=UPI003D1D5B74